MTEQPTTSYGQPLYLVRLSLSNDFTASSATLRRRAEAGILRAMWSIGSVPSARGGPGVPRHDQLGCSRPTHVKQITDGFCPSWSDLHRGLFCADTAHGSIALDDLMGCRGTSDGASYANPDHILGCGRCISTDRY